MTKTQMIETLRLKEAKAWLNLNEHEDYCMGIHGEESKYNDWTDTQKSIFNRLVNKWVTTSDLLKALSIEAYSYEEREAFKNTINL